MVPPAESRLQSRTATQEAAYTSRLQEWGKCSAAIALCNAIPHTHVCVMTFIVLTLFLHMMHSTNDDHGEAGHLK